jgi:prepilin-type N-terminal cleavage/methylation domain-containing protein
VIAVKNKLLMRHHGGFTIVELLIVVVVIAILATITVVSYNGIKDKSVSSATASNVNSYVKALAMYRAEHGGYPAYTTCLGQIADTESGCGSISYVGPKCLSDYGIDTEQKSVNYTVNGSFNNALIPYLGNIPMQVLIQESVKPIAEVDGCSYVQTVKAPLYTVAEKIIIEDDEVWFEASAAGENNKAYEISYPIKGNVECPLAGSNRTYISSSSITVCSIYGGNYIYD